MEPKKISARRMGRLFAILLYKNSSKPFEQNQEFYLNLLGEFVEGYHDLPENIQKRILSYGQETYQAILNNKEALKVVINRISKNRDFDTFVVLDQAILCVGVYELQNNDIPALIVKEMLIVSDLLNNHHAVPYISGILKTYAFGEKTAEKPFKKKRVTLKTKSVEK